jgi:ATP-dependent Zn protease
MTIFKISEDNIKKIKLNRLFIIISAIILTSVITQTIIYFTILQDTKVFLISLGTYIVMLFLIILFIIKFAFKSFEKTMKSIKYIIENERLIISQNDFEQFNITKDEIKCINKYKNNLIEIILKNNKKILVNKYLEKYDELLVELKQLSEISEKEKNPYFIQNIFAVIIGIIVMGTFFFSKNLFLVIISSILLFLFCLYLFIINIKNKNIDPKKRKMIFLLLPLVLFVIIQQIIELL